MMIRAALAIAFLGLASSIAAATGWLSTSGNRIVDSNGTTWVGHGANLHDTRSCGSGTAVDGTPLRDDAIGVNEVKRRIDFLTDGGGITVGWNATFIRLALESRRMQDDYQNDANYRSVIKQIVDYIGTKPNVYVLLSIWIDPSIDANGWPTAQTNAILARLATDFYAYPYVMFGVSNEPESNWDGLQDLQVWARMKASVDAIRAAEGAIGTSKHIITVQGTRDWARDLGYYVNHTIPGVNIAYETHIYNSPADFDALLAAAASIPVIVGEFGPVNDAWHVATVPDMQTLINKAKAANAPHLAWTFHQYCPPNLIADQPNKSSFANTISDGLGMTIYPTDFGQLLIDNWKAAVPAIANENIPYQVTSTEDGQTRNGTALVTRLDNFAAEKRPVVVMMPGWGGVGDVAAARNAQSTMFANAGYVALDVGFHQTKGQAWYSDLAESVKAALDALCVKTYVNCAAIVVTGQSYGGTQTHPVVRYLRSTGTYDGSAGANGGKKVVAFLGQDSGYTLYWDAAAANADATAYSIAMIENLGDLVFPVDSCADGNCGARNRADYHKAAAGSQYVLSYCPAGGSHATRGYANWDAWVLSAVKTMLHSHRGVAKFTGYAEPTIAVTNACTTSIGPGQQGNVDCDGNGNYDALTDGLIVVRYLLGVTGDALTKGALGSGATLTDPAAIKAKLDAMRGRLDIDGNGSADAWTDGLLLLRYMFGLRGSALIQGAIAADAQRNTAALVEAYLYTLLL